MDMNDKETKKELRRDTLILIITLAVLILASLCMYSCRSAKEVRTEQTRDSVRTEIRIHKVFVPDTVLVPLPPQKEYIITPDSESRLENDYAESYAAVKGGMLHHSLSTKPQDIPVEVVKEIEYRDSIVYRDREKTVEVEKEVEVRKLTWWDRTRFYALYAIVAAGAGWLVWRKLRNKK